MKFHLKFRQHLGIFLLFLVTVKAQRYPSVTVTIAVVGQSGSGVSSTIREILGPNTKCNLPAGKEAFKNIMEYELTIPSTDNTIYKLKLLDIPGFVSGRTLNDDSKILASLKSIVQSSGPPDFYLALSLFNDNRYDGIQSTFVQFLKRLELFQETFLNKTVTKNTKNNILFLLTHLMRETKVTQRRPESKINNFKKAIESFTKLPSPPEVIVGDNKALEEHGVPVENGYYMLPNKQLYPKNILEALVNLSSNDTPKANLLTNLIENRETEMECEGKWISTDWENYDNDADAFLYLLRQNNLTIENNEINQRIQDIFNQNDVKSQMEAIIQKTALQLRLQQENITKSENLPNNFGQRTALFQNDKLFTNPIPAKIMEKAFDLNMPEYIQQLAVGYGYVLMEDELSTKSPFLSNVSEPSPVGYQFPNFMECEKLILAQNKYFKSYSTSMSDYITERLKFLEFEGKENVNKSSFDVKVKEGFNLPSDDDENVGTLTAVLERRILRCKLVSNLDKLVLSPEFIEDVNSLAKFDRHNRESVNSWTNWLSKWGSHLVVNSYGGGSLHGSIIGQNSRNFLRSESGIQATLNSIVQFTPFSERNVGSPVYRFYGGESSKDSSNLYGLEETVRKNMIEKWEKSLNSNFIMLTNEMGLEPISKMIRNKIGREKGEFVEEAIGILLRGQLVYERKTNQVPATRLAKVESPAILNGSTAEIIPNTNIGRNGVGIGSTRNGQNRRINHERRGYGQTGGNGAGYTQYRQIGIVSSTPATIAISDRVKGQGSPTQNFRHSNNQRPLFMPSPNSGSSASSSSLPQSSRKPVFREDQLTKLDQSKVPEYIDQLTVGYGYALLEDEVSPRSPFLTNISEPSEVGFKFPNFINCENLPSPENKYFMSYSLNMDEYILERLKYLNFEGKQFVNKSSFNVKVKEGFNLRPDDDENVVTLTAVQERRILRCKLVPDPMKWTLDQEFIDDVNALVDFYRHDRESVNSWTNFFSKWGSHLVVKSFGGGSLHGSIVGANVRNVLGSHQSIRSTMNSIVHFTQFQIRNLGVPGYRFYGGESDAQSANLYTMDENERKNVIRKWEDSLDSKFIMLSNELDLEPISKYITLKIRKDKGKMVEDVIQILLRGQLEYVRKKKSTPVPAVGVLPAGGQSRINENRNATGNPGYNVPRRTNAGNPGNNVPRGTNTGHPANNLLERNNAGNPEYSVPARTTVQNPYQHGQQRPSPGFNGNGQGRSNSGYNGNSQGTPSNGYHRNGQEGPRPEYNGIGQGRPNSEYNGHSQGSSGQRYPGSHQGNPSQANYGITYTNHPQNIGHGSTNARFSGNNGNNRTPNSGHDVRNAISSRNHISNTGHSLVVHPTYRQNEFSNFNKSNLLAIQIQLNTTNDMIRLMNHLLKEKNNQHNRQHEDRMRELDILKDYRQRLNYLKRAELNKYQWEIQKQRNGFIEQSRAAEEQNRHTMDIIRRETERLRCQMERDQRQHQWLMAALTRQKEIEEQERRKCQGLFKSLKCFFG